MTAHELNVTSSFVDDDWTAECSCGWEQSCASEEAAVDAWENHCDVVFMEATS